MPPRRFDGRRLRARRREADMHQRVLGREAGVGSHEPVARWESGKSIPRPKSSRLSRGRWARTSTSSSRVTGILTWSTSDATRGTPKVTRRS